jgi:pimeloyl-ACP methyl ester carboxylesterase
LARQTHVETMRTRVPLYSGLLPQLLPAQPPWPGEIHRSGGVTLNIRHTPGPEQAGFAVYLHGLGGSSTNFTDLAGLVGVRLPGMAIDLPGFGRSAPPGGFDYAPDSHAEVVATFLAGLGHGSVHLVGNSLGGVVALLIAARRPHLVRTLTLLAPAMPDLRMDPRRMSDPRVALTMLPLVGTWVRRILIEVPPEEQIERMLRLCFADPSVVASARRAEAVAECIERIALTWAVTALRQSTQQLARSWLMPSSRSLWWVAAQVQAPALVVWGAADKLVTVRKAPRTAAALPRGRLLVLPRTGHLPQMEQPTSVARAMLGMIDAVDRAVW